MNRARPEGSIVEAYIADECLTFCSRYMDDVDTRFNREPRNMGFSNEEAYGVDVFGHGVNFTSAPELVYDENGFDQMVWFVLNNCSQVETYVEYVPITIFLWSMSYKGRKHYLIMLVLHEVNKTRKAI